MPESEFSKKLSALKGGEKKKSVRSVVKDNLVEILAALGRRVELPTIIEQIAAEVGHPVNPRTVQTYLSDFRNPTRPAKLAPTSPQATPAPPPAPWLSPKTQAPADKDFPTGATSGPRRQVEAPGVKKPVTPSRLT